MDTQFPATLLQCPECDSTFPAADFRRVCNVAGHAADCQCFTSEPFGTGADLARRRVEQIEDRIRARFPNAAKDGQLASLFASLNDELSTL